jgi:hypothetical protein
VTKPDTRRLPKVGGFSFGREPARPHVHAPVATRALFSVEIPRRQCAPENKCAGLWSRAPFWGIDGQNPKWCTAIGLRWGVAVNVVVDRILEAYQLIRPLDAARVADSRQKISRYIETLASAGQRDAEQLTIYGLAYLTELHEGQDPRFTGC